MRDVYRDLIKPALILVLVSVVVVALLAFTAHLTAPVIAERTQADLDAAKQAVLPTASTFTTLELPAGLTKESEGLGTVVAAWIAKDQAGTIVGTVVSSASKGYGGPVGFTIGLDPEGKVTGVKAGNHKETPGLGDKVLLPTGKVLKQLVGLNPSAPLKVVKGTPGPNEVDAVSGSTITSRAVTRAVSGAWELTTKLNEGGWK